MLSRAVFESSHSFNGLNMLNNWFYMYGIIFPILWIDSLIFFLFIFYIKGMNHILKNSFVLRIVIKVKIAVNIMSFG